jgi:hypothetical protein
MIERLEIGKCECCGEMREVNGPRYCEECWYDLSAEDARFLREEYEDDRREYLRKVWG